MNSSDNESVFTIDGVSEEIPGTKCKYIVEEDCSPRATKRQKISDEKTRTLELIRTGKREFSSNWPSGEWKSTREIVLAAVQQNGAALKFASELLQNDRDIVLAAVQQTGEALWYASRRLRQDREIVLAAVEQSYKVFDYCSSRLQNDREIVLAAVKQSDKAWRYVPKGFRRTVRNVAKQSGKTLKEVAELWNDRTFIRRVVRRNGKALKYVSKELKGDREIVLAAVKNHPESLQFASDALKHDREFGLEAVQQRGRAVQHLSRLLQGDREIVLAAVEQDGLAFVVPKLRRKQSQPVYRDNILRLLFHFDRNEHLEDEDEEEHIHPALEDFLKDRDIVLAAVAQNANALQYVSDQLKCDRDFALAAVQRNGQAVQYLSKSFLVDREIILTAVKQDGLVLRFLNNLCTGVHEVSGGFGNFRLAVVNLLLDREIVLAAVQNNVFALKWFPKALSVDTEIVECACDAVIRHLHQDTRRPFEEVFRVIPKSCLVHTNFFHRLLETVDRATCISLYAEREVLLPEMIVHILLN